MSHLQNLPYSDYHYFCILILVLINRKFCSINNAHISIRKLWYSKYWRFWRVCIFLYNTFFKKILNTGGIEVLVFDYHYFPIAIFALINRRTPRLHKTKVTIRIQWYPKINSSTHLVNNVKGINCRRKTISFLYIHLSLFLFFKYYFYKQVVSSLCIAYE